MSLWTCCKCIWAVSTCLHMFTCVCTCLHMLCYANKHDIIANQMHGADSLPVHGGCISAACFARCTDWRVVLDKHNTQHMYNILYLYVCLYILHLSHIVNFDDLFWYRYHILYDYNIYIIFLTQPQRTSFSNGSKTQRDHFIPMHHRSNYKTEGNIHGVRLLEPSWTIHDKTRGLRGNQGRWFDSHGRF